MNSGPMKNGIIKWNIKNKAMNKEAIISELERRIKEYVDKQTQLASINQSAVQKYTDLEMECRDLLLFVYNYPDESLILKPNKDLKEKAKELGQKYFPNEENIWARPNYEAKNVEYACLEMASWLSGEDHLPKEYEILKKLSYEEVMDKYNELVNMEYDKPVCTLIYITDNDNDNKDKVPYKANWVYWAPIYPCNMNENNKFILSQEQKDKIKHSLNIIFEKENIYKIL